MSWLRRTLLLGVPAVAFGLAARASAAQSGTAQLAGAYRYVGGKKQRELLDARIEEVVDELNFFVRSIARRRMKHANQIPSLLEISTIGDKLRVDIPGLRPIVSEADGRTFVWRDQYGEDVKVRQRIVGRTLTQHFQGKDGARDISYRLSSDGQRLWFSVTISSRWLPFPLQYQLSYRRTA